MVTVLGVPLRASSASTSFNQPTDLGIFIALCNIFTWVLAIMCVHLHAKEDRRVEARLHAKLKAKRRAYDQAIGRQKGPEGREAQRLERIPEEEIEAEENPGDEFDVVSRRRRGPGNVSGAAGGDGR